MLNSFWGKFGDNLLKKSTEAVTTHCVKWGVSWCWNHTIRTRILREYGHTRTYHVPRHATCPPRVRNRIRSDSDLTRVMGNPMSGYVIDTRRVETWKFPYTFRFAENNNVPYPSAWSVNLRLFFSCLSKNCLFHCSKNSFTKCSSRNSTVLDESICTLEPDFPRYYENRLVFRNPKFHGTWRMD